MKSANLRRGVKTEGPKLLKVTGKNVYNWFTTSEMWVLSKMF